MQTKYRELLRKRAAAGDPHAAFADRVLRLREAGVTRQATVAEIAPCVHGVWAPYNNCPECRRSA